MGGVVRPGRDYDLGAVAKPADSQRLFVAIHPPAEVVERLFEAVAAVNLPPHRLTPPDQVHLTLLFIGDVPASELDATVESVRRAAAGLRRFTLTVSGLIALPARGTKRLVAAEADRPATLLELQRRLVTRLAGTPRSGREGDRFLPHFTLIRFRQPSRLEALDVELKPAAFVVERITLMRSMLRQEGALHEAAAAIELADD
jgi:2'-5' RNA ligase